MSAPAESPALTAQVARGVRWGLVDVALQQVLRFAITVLLTRLLGPDQFGLLAMALVFTQLASLIGDLGLGPALVQRKEITATHVKTAFTATVAVGVVLTACLLALAGPIATFYDEPRLAPVLMALSATYLLRGLSGVPRELLRRNMQFRSFALVSGLAVLSGGTAGVVVALQGATVWALVASVLGEGIVATLAVSVVAARSGLWRPAFGADRTAFRELWSFGAYVSGGRIAYYGVTNVDNLIVGKVLGPASLGLYNLAYRLMLFPVLRVADVMANVTMPALATIQDDIPRVGRAFGRALQQVALVCVPVSVGTAVAAPALVPAVFGSEWTAASSVVQVLALNGVRLAIGRLNGVVYEATGRPKWDFVMLLTTFVVYVVAFVIGVHWDVMGVAWAYTVAGYLLVPVDQMLVTRCLGVSPFRLAPKLGAILAAALVMALAGAGTMALTSDLSEGLRAMLVVLASATTYLAALRIVAPGVLHEAAGSLLRR